MADLTPKQYVERLLEIQDFFSEKADEILDTLVEIGEPAIQPLIEDYLGCEDIYYGEELTFEISQALGAIGQPAIEALIAALDSENGFIHSNSARALGQIGDRQAIEPLKNAIHKYESYAALYGLAQIGGDDVAQFLLGLLESEKFEKASIIGWLGHTQSDLVFESLKEALEDDDPEVRRSAVWSLRTLNQQRAIDLLVSLIDDPDYGVQYATAIVLVTDLRDNRAAPFFADRLTHEHAHMRSTAVASLGLVGAQQYIDDIHNIMLNDADRYVRLACAVALIDMGYTKDDIPESIISKFLTHDDGYERFRTIQALSSSTTSKTISWLYLALQDKNAGNRHYAATILGKKEDLAALEPLKTSIALETHRVTKKAMQETITNLESIKHDNTQNP